MSGVVTASMLGGIIASALLIVSVDEDVRYKNSKVAFDKLKGAMFDKRVVLWGILAML